VHPLQQAECQCSSYAAHPSIHFLPGVGVLPGAGRFLLLPPVAMMYPWFVEVENCILPNCGPFRDLTTRPPGFCHLDCAAAYAEKIHHLPVVVALKLHQMPGVSLL